MGIGATNSKNSLTGTKLVFSGSQLQTTIQPKIIDDQIMMPQMKITSKGKKTSAKKASVQPATTGGSQEVQGM